MGRIKTAKHSKSIKFLTDLKFGRNTCFQILIPSKSVGTLSTDDKKHIENILVPLMPLIIGNKLNTFKSNSAITYQTRFALPPLI